MKLSITILLLIPIFADAQLKLLNKSLTTPDSSIIYYYWDNYLRLNQQLDLHKLRVVASHSKIKIEDSSIICEPQSLVADTIKIFQGKKLLLTQVFKVNKTTDPVAKLANTFDTVLTVNRILANPYISFGMPNCYYRPPLYVQSYECVIIKLNGEQFADNNSGNKLTNFLIPKIEHLQKGDKIYLKRVIIGGGGFSFIKLAPVNITIK